MAAPPPIIDLKKSFLSTQVRSLNAPLEPSSDWRENAPITEEVELKDRIVQDALQKCTIQVLLMTQAVDNLANSRLLSVVNITLRHHNRAVYSPSVLRHVAEQIYELYWESGELGIELANEGSETLERGAELKNHTWVNTSSVANAFELELLTGITALSLDCRTSGQTTVALRTVASKSLQSQGGQSAIHASRVYYS